jgi:hypothetical protein
MHSVSETKAILGHFIEILFSLPRRLKEEGLDLIICTSSPADLSESKRVSERTILSYRISTAWPAITTPACLKIKKAQVPPELPKPKKNQKNHRIISNQYAIVINEISH